MESSCVSLVIVEDLNSIQFAYMMSSQICDDIVDEH